MPECGRGKRIVLPSQSEYYVVLAEQIKDLAQRREALERCLDIEQKRIDLRNEEEKTQEPGFWDDPAAAREQLSLIHI